MYFVATQYEQKILQETQSVPKSHTGVQTSDC